MINAAIKLFRKLEKLNSKHFVAAMVFTLAFVGAVGLGLASRATTQASIVRDDDPDNSIDGCYANGGIGAEDANELLADIRDPKCASQHLATIYADPRIGGLTPDLYAQFAAEAKDGYIWRDGHVSVGNDTVWNSAWTMGRTTMGGKQRDPIVIGGVTYYHSLPEISFADHVDKLPAMVWFDANGEVRAAIMKACGNAIGGGEIVRNKVTCDALKSTQPDKVKKPNTYNFTTDAHKEGNATITRVEYHFSDDNSTVSKNSLTDAVEHTFTKDADVTVTVFATVPGGHEISSTYTIRCKMHITYVHPLAYCSQLIPSFIDDTKKAFRFTVIAKTDETGTTKLKTVDFILDDKTTTTNVTTKDSNGNVYKEYTFTDESSHTISVKLTFTTIEGEKTDATCKQVVTPAKNPKCTVPGHENEEPNSPKCGYCLPNVPIGDARCTPPVLVNTGPGSVLGLFGATSFAGFVGHRALVSRKNRRAAKRSE